MKKIIDATKEIIVLVALQFALVHPDTCASTESSAVIDPRLNITVKNKTSTSIAVTWDPIQSDHLKWENISGYRVSLNKASNRTWSRDYFLCQAAQALILKNLQVYTNYCIIVASFRRMIIRNNSQCLFATTGEEAPNAAPQNLSVVNASSTSLNITWAPLPLKHRRGLILGYKISYEELVKKTHGRVSRSPHSRQRSVNGSKTLEVKVDGLRKFTNYCVKAWAFNSKGDGKETKDVCVATDEDVPTQPPPNVIAFNKTFSNMFVNWTPISPEFIPGILLGYRLFYRKRTEPQNSKSVIISNGNLIAELRNLEEDTQYCIQLAGITRIGDGHKTGCLYVTTEKAIVTIVPQPSSEGSFSPSAVKVTWTVPSKNQGVPITGFYLHIKEKESSSLKPKALFENIITLANASQTSLVIRNLSVLTKYQVQMAAYSGRKVGNYSSPIIAETCRCPRYLPTATRPSPLEREGKSGIASVIADVVKKTCGTCKEHGQTELIPSNTSDIGDLSGVQFPVTLTSLPGESSFTFVPVLNVPGLVVLKRRGNKAAQKFYEKVITGSVMDAWPVLAVSVLMFYNMGVIVWFLDAKENPKQDELAWSFVKGAYEGSWWAFITMTTVGYGDQCLKSVRARLFALLWMIGSLVFLPFLTGAISTILTVQVMETKLTVPKSDGSAVTAAAITNSSEAKLAMGRLSNKFKLTATYDTLEALVLSFKEGDVDYILVDMYLPAKRKDLFNGSWFEVAGSLGSEFYHCAMLQGDTVKLAPALKEMIAFDDVQTKFMKDDEPAEKVTSKKESLFFDPTSPFFNCVIYGGLCVLCFFWVCGGLYQIIHIIRRRHSDSERDASTRMKNSDVHKELKTLVEEFYRSMCYKYEMIRRKHTAQLKEVIRRNKGR
ncbi:uncharacterized protein LOC141865386 isoform X1 [Acropora palmata]|uniref:uncharacterized protein LOC141865386 isoform X1 n=1 Tax=Acropora palmata TaxID=6131 RepID=UPI003DA136CF